MDVLKKIRSASLVESLTASVIIIVVFGIALISFNSIFQNNINRNITNLNQRINEISYLARNKKLELPFDEEQKYWLITGSAAGNQITLEITNKKNNQQDLIIIELQ